MIKWYAPSFEILFWNCVVTFAVFLIELRNSKMSGADINIFDSDCNFLFHCKHHFWFGSLQVHFLLLNGNIPQSFWVFESGEFQHSYQTGVRVQSKGILCYWGLFLYEQSLFFPSSVSANCDIKWCNLFFGSLILVVLKFL